MPASPAPASRITSRIVSVDALRGLTVAFMILVNDPGDWAHVYAPLDHAEWNGFTPTDLVFPTFLFLVGCSIVFSISSRLAAGVARSKIALQIARRAVTIFLLKMFLSAYPHFHLTHLRIYGVLTRIALCYLVAGFIFLYVRSTRALLGVLVALLVGYWMLMRFVPIPGLGTPTHDFAILDPDRNLAAWLDRHVSAWCLRWVHMGRLYQNTRDPEGLLSTLPAVATTLLGVLTALWLRAQRLAGGRTILLRGVTAGLLCLALGRLWNPWFPINKNLWTSSYVLFAGGWSLLLLAVFYWLFDSQRVQERSLAARALLWPLLVYGSNAITAFLFSELAVESLIWWKVPLNPAFDPEGDIHTAWAWLYYHLFARQGSTENTSVAFALAFVVVCFIPNWLLWQRKLFLRV